MSTTAKQALVLAVGGLVIIAVILRLARAKLLSTRYTLGWLGVGALIAMAAALMPFVGRLGRLANMTPTAVLLTFSSVVLLAISVQLSISVSLLQERLRATAEAHALLAERLHELEERVS
jgi:low affinity Fe/Cu permease